MDAPKEKELVEVTMDTEEFEAVLERVHRQLFDRAKEAQEAKEKSGSEEDTKAHIEAAKDVFVVVHLIELVEHLSGEVSELRSVVEEMGGVEIEVEALEQFPQMFSAPTGSFMN